MPVSLWTTTCVKECVDRSQARGDWAAEGGEGVAVTAGPESRRRGPSFLLPWPGPLPMPTLWSRPPAQGAREPAGWGSTVLATAPQTAEPSPGLLPAPWLTHSSGTGLGPGWTPASTPTGTGLALNTAAAAVAPGIRQGGPRPSSHSPGGSERHTAERSLHFMHKHTHTLTHTPTPEAQEASVFGIHLSNSALLQVCGSSLHMN